MRIAIILHCDFEGPAYIEQWAEDNDHELEEIHIYKDGVMAHYVNGQKELEGNVDYQVVNSGQTSLGVRLNKVSWFKGAIHSVKVTPAVLSPTEFMEINSLSVKKVDKNQKYRWTRDEQLELATKVGNPQGKAQDAFSYADVNFLLCTEIIEQITEKPFYTAIKELLKYETLNLSNTKTDLNLTSLKSGIYLVKLSNEGKKISHKIIIE